MLAHLVRAHRGRARLTQEELAERASLSVRALRDLECGRTRFPRRASLRRLAAALDLTDADRTTLESAYRTTLIDWAAVGPWCLPQVSGSVPIGKVGFLREIEEAFSRARGGGHPTVVAVHGGAGAGKTTLAVQGAHLLHERRAADFFYVGLRDERRRPDVLAAELRRARSERARRNGAGSVLIVDDADTHGWSEGARDLLALGFTTLVVTSREPVSGVPATVRLLLARLEGG